MHQNYQHSFFLIDIFTSILIWEATREIYLYLKQMSIKAMIDSNIERFENFRVDLSKW